MTGFLLVALVVIPGLILGWMAIRAAAREEAVVESQLRTTLLAEVTPAADRVAELLDVLRTELSATVPDSAMAATLGGAGSGNGNGSGTDTSGGVSFGSSATGGSGIQQRRPGALDAWSEAEPLVDVPFLFQRTAGTFFWPAESSAYLSNSEREFLDLNLDFFQDRRSVEVFSNVATDFADEKLRADERLNAGARLSAAASSEADAVADADGKQGTVDDATRLSKGELRQQALSEFEKNEEFRDKLYEDAKKSGKTVSPRSTLNLKDAKNKVAERYEEPAPSLYVTESLRFSQILGDAEEGWISRLVDDRIVLIYWKRMPDDRIVGCTVDGDQLRSRILEVMPVALTSARILTVLDHASRPLFDPEPEVARNWRVPFVSREISEHLPRWEVAAYLTNPDVIRDRAHTRTLAIGLLVGVLVVSIMTGGFVVSRMLQSEMRLAEQKTTFVANVSHELKTPLTSIRLLSEMLRDGRQKDPEKQRKYLDIVVSETERLTRLINNVLDFSRLHREGRRYSPSPVDLVALCQEIVETQEVRLRHAGFTVESELEPDDAWGPEGAWATVDAESIKQALLNLVSNAEKYSPNTKWIRIGLRRDGHDALLSVADRGIGIRASDAAKIFDEFYRADDSLTANVRGTGLGLTLTRRIVEDHGGRITYRANPGGGSIFEVRLPLKDDSKREAASPPHIDPETKS